MHKNCLPLFAVDSTGALYKVPQYSVFFLVSLPVSLFLFRKAVKILSCLRNSGSLFELTVQLYTRVHVFSIARQVFN